MGHSVELFIYDVTQGLARQMSQSLLGKQLDGVWHTGVHVFNREYFFGSMGISSCDPHGTILGRPHEVVDMGQTEIPEDVFIDYLAELGTSTFRGDQYHLMEHNCNTFSKEVVEFLTGNVIPAKITDLPNEVMNTPFGAFLKPFIDNMMSTINSGMHLNSEGHFQSSLSPTVQAQEPAKPNSSQKHEDHDLD